MYRLLLFLMLLMQVSFIQKPALKAFYLEGYAQGTTYHITYYHTHAIIRQVAIDSILNGIDSSLSLYKPYSRINRFNRSAEGITTDHYLKTVVAKSLEIYKETDGLFDVTVQPLVEAWGFGVKHPDSLPDSARISTLLKCVGTGKLSLKNNYLHKRLPCVKIDLNGIAQGYTADVLANYLRSKGIQNFLAEIGGELVVSGRRQPGGEKMSVGIEAPGNDPYEQAPYQRIVHLAHGALTTSGNYRKFYESGAKKINHLIDPHTGYSFQTDLISVTVWAKDGITADGYDNALMGMGLKKAMEFVERKKDLGAYFIYTTPDGVVRDTATRSFYTLLQ